MSAQMQIRFPGGAGVDAVYRGYTIHTDQPAGHGGLGEGPAPFDLFLASIGTCAGYYALRFCQERAIPTAGMALTMETVKDAAAQRIGRIRLELTLPEGFPAKYRQAIERAMDQCAVKRAIAEPPQFETVTVAPDSQGATAPEPADALTSHA